MKIGTEHENELINITGLQCGTRQGFEASFRSMLVKKGVVASFRLVPIKQGVGASIQSVLVKKKEVVSSF